MKLFARRAISEKFAAEKVSRAVEAPGMQWDECTRQIASVGRLLESGVAPDETARSQRKAAMLAEFDRKHHRPTVGEAQPVVIVDIDPISDDDASLVAARFTALIEPSTQR